jgi:hypothetical protein
MPAVPKPKLPLPMLPPTPEMLLALKKPPIAMPEIPVIDQPKLVKPLLPFLDLGKGVASGKIKCC